MNMDFCGTNYIPSESLNNNDVELTLQVKDVMRAMKHVYNKGEQEMIY